MDRITEAAVEALRRGYQPIFLRPRDKRPIGGGWQKPSWPEGAATPPETVQEKFDAASDGFDESINVGVLLGEPSGNLMDVDLDHSSSFRLRDFFLPRTPARGGRAGKPNSHYWYVAKPGTLPGTRQHMMPRTQDGQKGAVIVELRSTGAQTVLPPSVHPSGERYTWTRNTPWGGDEGPAEVDGRVLAVQVATLALASVLKATWPTKGSRHEAYLALAGGLLRYGDNDVHPYWEANAEVLIGALADVTDDDDGSESRIAESVHTTVAGLKAGKPITGFPKLAEILGDRAVEQIRLLISEIESAAGFTGRNALVATPQGVVTLGPAGPVIDAAAQTSPAAAEAAARLQEAQETRAQHRAETPDDQRDPLGERMGSWEPVDLDPYLSGQITPVSPTVFERDDGQCLMYPGRLNMIYGSSESAKSFIALRVALQEMAKGLRVLYIDFEDEPVNTLSRLKLMGADPDDLKAFFAYIRPEEPIASMQRDRWGKSNESDVGRRNLEVFTAAIMTLRPSIIVADGMTALYGLHGLDTNGSADTDVITTWLKSLSNNGETTVILIDHTGKGSERGSLPIGSQHKQAMVQGTMLQAWMIDQPMPGVLGKVELIVVKDRPGTVRAASVKSGTKAQLAATVEIDSRIADVTTLSFIAPPSVNGATSSQTVAVNPAQARKAQQVAERRDRHRDEEERIKFAFGGRGGVRMTQLEIMQALGVAPDDATALGVLPPADVKLWRAAIDRMLDDGHLDQYGMSRDRVYEFKIDIDGYQPASPA